MIVKREELGSHPLVRWAVSHAKNVKPDAKPILAPDVALICKRALINDLDKRIEVGQFSGKKNLVAPVFIDVGIILNKLDKPLIVLAQHRHVHVVIPWNETPMADSAKKGAVIQEITQPASLTVRCKGLEYSKQQGMYILNGNAPHEIASSERVKLQK